jgi:hypothetical protein
MQPPCPSCGTASVNGYCPACGAAVARPGGSGVLASLAGPFAAIWRSFGLIPRPHAAADGLKAGTLRFGDCLAGYLAWAALGALLMQLFPAAVDPASTLVRFSEIGGDWPLIGEAILFALLATIFVIGFLPLHLLLKAWKGPRAHFADGLALYLLYGGPFLLLSLLTNPWLEWPARGLIWLLMLAGLARLYTAPLWLLVGWYLLITLTAMQFIPMQSISAPPPST